jgi:hypothetical protein
MSKFFIYIMFLTASFAGCNKPCSETDLNNLTVKMFITPNVPRIKVGDTLKLLLQIKFKENRLNDGKEVNVQLSSLTTSGIDFRTIKRVNGEVVADGNNFIIVPIKGSYSRYNNVAIRASYQKMSDAFEFEAYIIPIQKGIANFANYKAEGWMNGKCILNSFSPIIGSEENNHQLYRDFFGPGADGFIPENNYYVWVE